jgi:molecular chaperone GrpE
MIYQQYQNTLKKLEVQEMAGEGEEFNPELHNAVSHIEDENLGEGVISAVFQKGYMLRDKVVRHAMVQVAN